MLPNSNLKIGIVGAGTAGLASAIALARAGHAVTVFEKHPSLTSLGAGLLIQPQGIAALDALGVGAAFHAASVPVTRLLGTCHRDWTLVDIPYDDTEARGVSRAALAQVLLESALALGVQIRYGSAVDRIAVDGAQATIHTAARPFTFDLVAIADGAASTLPAQVGLSVASTVYRWGALWATFDVADWPDQTLLEQRYHATRKMFGLMPTARMGDRLRLSMFWSLPRADYAAWRARPLQEWKDELLALWPAARPVVEQIVHHDQFTLATYHHARARRLADGPVCVIGDAAHAMSPQLGLGSTLAVQDALALAAALAERGGDRRRRAVFQTPHLRGAQLPAAQPHTDALLPGRQQRPVARPDLRRRLETARHPAPDVPQHRRTGAAKTHPPAGPGGLAEGLR